MATHSSLTWRIPWTEEPGGLQSIGLHRVRHDWSDLVAAAAAHPLSKASRVGLILYKDEVSQIRSLLYAHPCHSPVSLGVECRVLTAVYLCDQVPPPLTTSSSPLPITHSAPALQISWLFSEYAECSPPQGLCTFCTCKSFLEHPSPIFAYLTFLTSSTSPPKVHLIREVF